MRQTFKHIKSHSFPHQLTSLHIEYLDGSLGGGTSQEELLGVESEGGKVAVGEGV